MRIDSTPFPPLGWNSYDSYGIYLTEEDALANLDAFVKKLKPHGYEYFCIDACWYAEGDFRMEKTKRFMNVDEFGRFVESPKIFPHGLKYLADKCHENGVKFGIHIMRGLPAKAVELNTPVKGHPTARARDIVDLNNGCTWSYYTRGIDMTKPGAQEYYDSVIERLAEIGVDLIKADDIVDYPAEVEAVGKAIENVKRPIVLSLSPGNEPFEGNWSVLSKYGNMLRITGDIWDRDSDIAIGFERWGQWEHFGSNECWLDLDMIPFGAMQVHVPEDTPPPEYPVLGCRRQSNVSPTGKLVMMTQRALAASPLIFGGAVHLSNEGDIRLITDKDMLECNRNGVTGKRIFWQRHIDVRRALKKGDERHGWLGIFNRQCIDREITLTPSEIGFGDSFPSSMFSIWDKKELTPANGRLTMSIKADGVVFVRY